MATTTEQRSPLAVSKEKAVKSLRMQRGDEHAEDFNKGLDWESISDYELENENGSKIQFSDVYREYPTIVIFIRHFLCYIAKDYMEDLALIPRQLLEEHKIRLVVIGCGQPKYMKQFRRDTGYWAEFYTDSSRELYKLMSCQNEYAYGRVDSSLHVKTSAIMGILSSAWRSMFFPGEWQGDQNQQGGAFIMGPGDAIHFIHTDKNAADHYPINKLLDMVGVPNVSFPKDKGVRVL